MSAMPHALRVLRADYADPRHASALVELLVGRAVKRLAGLVASQQHHVLMEHLEFGNIPKLFTEPHHEFMWVLTELQNMSNKRLCSRQNRRKLWFRARRISFRH